MASPDFDQALAAVADDERVAELRTALHKARRALAAREETTALLVDAVYRAAKDAWLGSPPPPRPPKPRAAKGKSTRPHVAVVHTTDWQCIAKGSIVMGRDGSACRIEDHPDSWSTGVRSVVRLRVEGGGDVRLTKDHLVRTPDGWTEAGQLRRGDRVLTLARQDAWVKRDCTESEAFLLGLLASDGYVGRPRQSPKFTNTDAHLLDWVQGAAADMFGIAGKRYPKGNGYDLLLTAPGSAGNPVSAWWSSWSPDDGFPVGIFDTSPTAAGSFIAGLMAGDGCITTRGPRKQPSIELACGTETYARYALALLGKCGIAASARSEMMAGGPFWRLLVCAGAQNIERFVGLVSAWLPEPKRARMEAAARYHHDRRRISESPRIDVEDGQSLVSRRVLGVTPDGESEVFDMEVPGKGWFVANQVAVHNCGKRTTDFDSDVLRTRLERMWDIIGSLVDRHSSPVSHCVLLFGGDMIEGVNLFPSQPYEVDSTLYDQTANVEGNLRLCVDSALELFASVQVVEEFGNHGRIGKFGEIPAGDNIDRLCYRHARDHYAATERLTWQWSDDFMQVFEVGAYRAALLHGNEFAKTFSAERIVRKLTAWQTQYDFADAYVGHFHRRDVYGLPAGGSVYLTGSPESSNAYAAEVLAARGRPSQRLNFVDPEWGLVMAEHVLWVDR